MYLVSWNCASWKKTLEHIQANHKPAKKATGGITNETKATSSASATISAGASGLEEWLSQLQADILCLQEVKIDRTKV